LSHRYLHLFGLTKLGFKSYFESNATQMFLVVFPYLEWI